MIISENRYYNVEVKDEVVTITPTTDTENAVEGAKLADALRQINTEAEVVAESPIEKLEELAEKKEAGEKVNVHSVANLIKEVKCELHSAPANVINDFKKIVRFFSEEIAEAEVADVVATVEEGKVPTAEDVKDAAELAEKVADEVPEAAAAAETVAEKIADAADEGEVLNPDEIKPALDVLESTTVHSARDLASMVRYFCAEIESEVEALKEPVTVADPDGGAKGIIPDADDVEEVKELAAAVEVELPGAKDEVEAIVKEVEKAHKEGEEVDGDLIEENIEKIEETLHSVPSYHSRRAEPAVSAFMEKFAYFHSKEYHGWIKARKPGEITIPGILASSWTGSLPLYLFYKIYKKYQNEQKVKEEIAALKAELRDAKRELESRIKEDPEDLSLTEELNAYKKAESELASVTVEKVKAAGEA